MLGWRKFYVLRLVQGELDRGRGTGDHWEIPARARIASVMFPPVTSKTAGPTDRGCFKNAAAAAAPAGSATTPRSSYNRRIAPSNSASLTKITSSTNSRIAQTLASSGVRVAKPSAHVSQVAVGITRPSRHDKKYEGARSACTPIILTVGFTWRTAAPTPRISAVSPIGTNIAPTCGS